jgi:hypothetical protein
MEPQSGITGTVQVKKGKAPEDFATWVFGRLSKAINLDPDFDEKVFLGNYSGGKDFYLWSVAEDSVQQVGAGFDELYFKDFNHLHLIKSEDGENTIIVFTHRVQHRASDFGDSKEIRAANKEAKQLGAVKHHPGGRSDGTSCLLVSSLSLDDFNNMWLNVPEWQRDLVIRLRKFVGDELRDAEDASESYTDWWEQWKEISAGT